MLLQQKEYNIAGGWYEPLHKLQSYKSIIKADYIQTCSSAGDWEGYFIQKHNGHYYMFTFSQVNNWPHSGFTLYTSHNIIRFDSMPTEDEIMQTLEYLWN